MTITERLSRLTAISILTLFDEVLKENETLILDLNRDQMYDDGTVNVENPTLREQYALSTIRAKRKAPFPKTDFITLKWFGTFYSQMKLIIFRDTFVIQSDNSIWANFLEPQDRFGKALGLTAKSKDELRDVMKNELIKKIKNEL
jgi:hypothetical protein